MWLLGEVRYWPLRGLYINEVLEMPNVYYTCNKCGQKKADYLGSCLACGISPEAIRELKLGRQFVIGDIHGRFEALKQVLKKADFNYEDDLLIVLGDVADGGYNTAQVVEELLKIKHLVYIIGNHDEWFMNHIRSGWAEEIWLQQGGCNTLTSYGAKCKEANNVSEESKIDTRGLNIPVTHQDFFNRGVYYFVLDNMLFVHGGINPKIPKLESQSRQDLLWDRHLIQYAKENKVQDWDKVFVGHTTTQHINGMLLPVRYNNLWALDTGAGWNGKLTIMNIDTEKFWQSELQKPAIDR